MTDLGKSITRTVEAYKTAVYARDAEAFIRLYDPKVRVFDTWGIWEYENATKWMISVENWLNSLGSEKVQVAFNEIQVAGSTDFAFLSAIVTYTALSAEGKELRSMENRLSWVLKQSGHILRIVHEHTSAPIGFEDMKAILHRRPAE